MPGKEQNTKEGGLPATRIRTIMKSSPDIESVSQESLYLITKATELFVQQMTQESVKLGRSGITYDSLSKVVAEQEVYHFLADILPHKMKVKDFYAMLEQGGTESEEDSVKEDSSKED